MEDELSDNITLDVNATVLSVSKSLISLLPESFITCVIVFIAVAIFLGIPGNALVLVVLTRNTVKTSTDWFIIFIAVCDLTTLAVNGSIDILRYQPEQWKKIGSPFLCKSHYYVMNVLFIESNVLILFVGVDRYLKTFKPHGRYFTPGRSFWFCVGVTVGSMICATPNVFTSTALESGTYVFDKAYKQLRVVFIMCMVTVNVISSIVLIPLYARIAHALKSRVRADRKRRENTMRVLKSGGDRTHETVTNHIKGNGTKNLSLKNQHLRIVLSNERQLSELTNTPTTSRAHKMTTNGAKQQTTSFIGRAFYQYTKRGNAKVHPGDYRADVQYEQNYRCAQREEGFRTNDRDASHRASKTTKVMFAITILYIVSTVIPTITAPFLTETKLRNYPSGQAFIFLILRLYTINNFANPILYMILSSPFRKRAVRFIKFRTLW